MTSLELAQNQVQLAYSDANSLISHAIDVAKPYIDSHAVKIYADGSKFRTAISDLTNSVRSGVLAKINEALVGFNQKSQNSSIDYNEIITTSDEATAFSDYIKEFSDKLSASADEVMTKVDSLIESHTLDRPLLRSTGNRKFDLPIKLDILTTYAYEFKNIGNKPWSGFMTLKFMDNYKKSVTFDFAPPTIPVVDPGDTVWLSREVKIDKIQHVDGNPRTWGAKTKIYTSIYTRLS